MKTGRAIRLIVFALIVVFVVSRMRVGFREYMNVEYSPVSTYATIALVIISTLLSFYWIPIMNKSKLNKRVFLFLVICLVSTFLYGNPTLSLGKQLVFIAFWECVFLLFYGLTYNQEIAFIESKWLFYLLLIPVSLLYISSNTLRGAMDYSLSRAGNNMVFYLITLLPWLLTSKKRALRISSVLFIMVMGLLSLKRSVLIILLLSTFPFLYYEFFKTSKNRSKTIIIGIITIVAGVVLFNYFNKISDFAAIERMTSIEEDEGSGRIDRYTEVINLINNEKDVVKILFGHGYRTVEITLMSVHSSAHNDFLEVLFDYGYVGLFMLLLIHFALIKRIFYLKSIESEYLESYIVSYIIFLIMNIVSHLIIIPTYFIFLTSYWGAIEGLILAEKRNKISFLSDMESE